MNRIRVSAKQLGDRHFQINLSGRVALVTQSLLRAGKNGRKARVKAAYFGFESQQQAMQFANQVRGRFPAARIQVRAAKRLGTAIEVKISHSAIEQFTWQYVSQQQPLSQKIASHVAAENARVDRLAAENARVDRLAAENARVDRLAALSAVTVDRSAAPLQNRSGGRQVVRIGGMSIGIE